MLLAGCSPQVATSFWRIGTAADSTKKGYTIIHAEGKTRHCYPVKEWKADPAIDTYHQMHHHGVAVESDKMAYRIYFDKKQTIDPYCKRVPQLELASSYWYPNDSLLAAHYGDDILRVSGTVGVGSVKYWNGKKHVHIEPVAERSQRIVKQSRKSATIGVAVEDWQVEGKIVDMDVQYTMQSGHRDMRCDVYLSEEVEGLCTGVQMIPNNGKAKVVQWTYLPSSSTFGWTLTTVTKMASNYELYNPGYKVIAAINGDFFDIESKASYGPLLKTTRGVGVSDGEVIRAMDARGLENNPLTIGFKNNGKGDNYVQGGKIEFSEYHMLTLYDEEDKQDNILELIEECAKAGNPDMYYEFCSTSKITFPGSGIAALVTSPANIKDITKFMTVQTIGHDKLNQMRHVKFFGNAAGVHAHMEKHAAILRPKFEAVLNTLEQELGGLEIGSWLKPLGGYFVAFDTLEGCAKRVVALCKEAGVVMTPAGSTEAFLGSTPLEYIFPNDALTSGLRSLYSPMSDDES